ncbi:hypothetical protein ACP70R_019266 [Stipagrostis hirtigluma subsp. patula]
MSSSTAIGGAGGKLSWSTSSIVADTARGCHILKIDGYSLTKYTPTGVYIKSIPFTVGGHRWRLRYYPKSSQPDTADYIGIYLILDQTVAKEVKAQYQFRFVDEVVEPPVTLEEVDSFPGRGGWGYTKFFKRAELEKSVHLKGDSFAIRCDIAVIKEFRIENTHQKFVSVPQSDLHRHLGNLLRTKLGADVVFDVGGVTFAAHRWMLAARSPVFSAALFGTMKESDTGGVVHIRDMEPQVFKALLYFIYTDLFPEMTEGEEDTMAQHLLVAADRYNLERLKLICEKLCNCIDVGRVANILTLAEQHHCRGLKKACFDFLSTPANLRAVVATDGFDHLNTSCPSITKELLAMVGNLVQ